MRARLRSLLELARDGVSASLAGRAEKRQVARVRSSVLFDRAHYLQANPDVARMLRDPVRHFVRYGWREGRDPHPLFDTSWYLATYPEVTLSAVDPLTEFVTSGWRLGRNPHPLFDTGWYLETHPEAARSGLDPLSHFVTQGWRDDLDPHPMFDTSHYLDSNPDVAEVGLNPLVHFIGPGWREGRDPHPQFDTRFYLDRHPDVAGSGMNPLEHFVRFGMAEGRHPGPGFDDARSLPLPASAWSPGRTEVERVMRTFVYDRKRPVTAAQARELIGQVDAVAAAQPALSEAPAVSVIIPVFNQLKLTLWCLHAVLAGAYRSTFEVLVVDDGSVDGTADVLQGAPVIRYVRSPSNQGFIRACNLGARHARGDTLVFLNNDTVPLDGWLDALIDTLRERPDAGLVGAKLVYPAGRLQEAGGILWQTGAAWNYGRGGDPARPEFNYRRSVDFCSGAALAAPSTVFRDAGGFDESLAPAYGEDVELALRLRERGLAVLYQPRSEVVHVEGATGGTSRRRGVKAYQVRNLETIFQRWQGRLRAHRPEGQDPHLEKDRGVERRVLFADAFTPRPDEDAGSQDSLHWMLALDALGFRVTFLPCIERQHAGRYTTDLQRWGIECVNAPDAPSLEDFVAARGAEFDLCVLYRHEVASALLPMLLRCAPQAQRLLAVCDLAHVRKERQAALSGSARDAREALETKFRELLACAQCDAVWTPSRWEKEHLLREIPHARVLVWPLAQELRPARKSFAERTAIGFIGAYVHAPNVDAVLFFVREILPHIVAQEPRIVFHVAGSNMPPEIARLDHPAVRVLGQVADLTGFFESLRMSVAPLRFGAGLKGKVAASLAAGVPVVATSLALEGMELEPEEGALVADDPPAFAREVVRLYGDEALWTRLSRAGYARAQRDYSTAEGLRHIARATLDLGVPTPRARAHAGDVTPVPWPGIPGMRVDVCRTPAEYRALRESDEFQRRVAVERRLLEEAEGGGVRYRAWSAPARRAVVYRAQVRADAAGRLQCGWREELACPITRLNNWQRAVATFAQRMIEDREQPVSSVYVTEQVTPLFEWMSSRFRTVGVTGSEYLGPGLAGGEMRDSIQHQDVERLAFDPASFDLVVSCDVLEHVNEPRRALAELARVLRPGGHLLFTVPFAWSSEADRRRSRDVGGYVEHLVEPSCHGNPLDPAGSPACFDYGWELLDWVRDAGFREVSVLCYWSDTLGHLGGLLEAFLARR